MTLSKEEKTALVERYIQAYNRTDVPELLDTLHPEVVFEHLNNDRIVLRLEGRTAFQEQFEQTSRLFQERIQTLTVESVDEHSLRAAVHFYGKLHPTDALPKPEDLYLEGHSYFGFQDGKIIFLQDLQGNPDHV